MLRKCKVGKDHRPAFFHGWFNFADGEGGMNGMGIVEFDSGTTDFFSPGFVTFDTPPTADIVESAPSASDNTIKG